MQTLKYLVTIIAANSAVPAEVYRSVRDGVFSQGFASATVMPAQDKAERRKTVAPKRAVQQRKVSTVRKCGTCRRTNCDTSDMFVRTHGGCWCERTAKTVA